MIALSLHMLAEITGGKLTGHDLMFGEVTTDTRHIRTGCLFIALQGSRFDAHAFVADAVNAGAAALLVSKAVVADVPHVVVEDTRIALAQLAGWVRQQSGARVVALTGSSGKTSVKEMTAAILRECGETLYTAGNFNNDIGVPLTLLRLSPQHRYAVIELGANHQGEIAWTTAIARPEAALINNLAAAHLEGFGSLAGVAKAKGEIFQGLAAKGTAIINNDSHDLVNWQVLLAGRRLWRFSPQHGDFSATNVCVGTSGTRFLMRTPAGEVDIHLPLPGRHNVANALAAAALAQAVDAPLDAIQKGLSTLQAVPGRLFPIPLSAEKLLLDDSYNANVGSMTAAVQTLADMPGYRVLVVGDMAELGAEAAACHREVGDMARQKGIDRVISVGGMSKLISDASGNGEHYSTQSVAVDRLRALLAEHDNITILVKGSRSAAMERVVQQLQEKGTC